MDLLSCGPANMFGAKCNKKTFPPMASPVLAIRTDLRTHLSSPLGLVKRRKRQLKKKSPRRPTPSLLEKNHQTGTERHLIHVIGARLRHLCLLKGDQAW